MRADDITSDSTFLLYQDDNSDPGDTADQVGREESGEYLRCTNCSSSVYLDNIAWVHLVEEIWGSFELFLQLFRKSELISK